jgi:raffinose synthase
MNTYVSQGRTLCPILTHGLFFNAAGVSAAAQLSGGALPRTQKVTPPSLDVFGWCTWDAFYSTVSAKGIKEGLKSLLKGGIRPRMLIIDDGWQTTDVDPEHRKAPTSELAQQLHLRKQDQQLLETYDEVFFDGSIKASKNKKRIK